MVDIYMIDNYIHIYVICRVLTCSDIFFLLCYITYGSLETTEPMRPQKIHFLYKNALLLAVNLDIFPGLP